MSCKNTPKQLYSEEGRKEINGTHLYVKVVGSGEPILIIHGGPGLNHQYLFQSLVPLAGQYQLIFYDQRASGSSDLELDAELVTLDNFVKDIDGLRSSFAIEKINIMAHSWGGLLGMKYAIENPNRIKSLILVNSVGASSKISDRANQVLAKRFTDDDNRRRIELMESEALKLREPQAIESLMKIGFKHQFYNDLFLDSLHLSLDGNYMKSSQLLQNLGKEMSNFDYHSDLKSIECPTLLIYGSYDPLTELAGQKLNESIVNSELKVLDDCGHFPFIEKTDEFGKTVRSFMQQNR